MRWLQGQTGNPIGWSTYVLIAVLVVTLWGAYAIEMKDRAARARARATGGAGSPAPAGAALVAGGRASLPAEATTGWGRDPFRKSFSDGGDEGVAAPVWRSGRPSSSGSGLFLQGVMVGPTGRTALINGQIVREGDRVGSYSILSIGHRSVVLMQNGSATTLTIRGGKS